MSTQCKIIPEVRNILGQLVESKLFKGLLSHIVDRNIAYKTYGWLKSEEIQQKLSFVSKDTNGEFLLKELAKLYDFSALVGQEQFIKNLERIHKTKKVDGSYKLSKDGDDFRAKAKTFNTDENNPFNHQFKMITIAVQTQGGYKMYANKIVKKEQEQIVSQKQYKLEQEKTKVNKALNDKIRLLAIKYGLSIEGLNDLDKALKINGVFETGKTTANGILAIIRLAEGEKGEQALPEEFAHFIIESLGNHPLLTRLLIQLDKNDALVKSLLGDSYETYKQLYGEDNTKLVKEAAGKLVAKHFLNNEDIESGDNSTLLKRFINAIRQFFSQLGNRGISKDLNNAILDLDTQFGQFAKDIMSGSLDSYINNANLLPLLSYYLVANNMIDLLSTLSHIIETEQNRYINFSGRKTEQDNKQLVFLNKLKSFQHKKEYINGITAMLVRSTELLKTLKERSLSLVKEVSMLDEESDSTEAKKAYSLKVKELAATLRDIKEYTDAYTSIASKISEDIFNEDYMHLEPQYTQAIKEALELVNALSTSLQIAYKATLTPLFIKFMSPFIGDSLKIISERKGKTVTLESIASESDGDIGIVDYWVNSMANTNDTLLNLVDLVVKDHHFMAEQEALNTQKRLSSILFEYEEKSGSKDTSWMYEKDENGYTTGTYVLEIDYKAFKKAREDYNKSLPKMDIDDLNRTLNEWFVDNTIVVNNMRVPNPAKYNNKAFDVIKNDANKLKLYNSIMEEKEKIDKLLPEHKRIPLYLAVLIRKEAMERLISKGGFSVNTIVETFKDQFVVRENDFEFGNIDTNGNVVMELPIYFTKPIGEPRDLSTDLIGTLSAYATMAHKYDHMSDIVDSLELTREVIANRKNPNKGLSGKPLIRKMKIFGVEKEEQSVSQNSNNTNILKRYDSFMTMQVYGQLKKKESHSKVVDTIIRLTSMNNLGFNYINNIANVTNGMAMMEIERFAGQFFNKKDVVVADLIWGKEAMSYMADLGQRNKQSKMALFNEKFNVMQNASHRLKYTQFKKSLWMTKAVNLETFAFFGGDAGEIWMNTRTAVALAVNHKLKDKDGKEISLWDALEVTKYSEENKDKEGNLITQEFKTNTLKLKEGVTKLDGTEFTSEDMIKFQKLSASINQRMFGIYNEIDRNTAQLYAMGRAAMLFRKYMVPAVNRRFAVGKYNFDSQTWDEGYYRTAGKVLYTLYTDFRHIQNESALRWSELDKEAKLNIIRASTEIALFLLSAISIALLGAGGDKHDKGWLATMMELQARRFNLELGAMVPEPITMFKSANKLVQDPFASSNYLNKVTNLFNFLSYTDVLESGRYKGHYKAYKYFMDVLPAHTVLYKFNNPEEALKFYKNQ